MDRSDIVQHNRTGLLAFRRHISWLNQKGRGEFLGTVLQHSLIAVVLSLLVDVASARSQDVNLGGGSATCDSFFSCGQTDHDRCMRGGRAGMFRLQKRSTKDPGVLFAWQDQSPSAGVSTLNEPLTSDRPDFTESSQVVGLGVFQVESGYTYSYNSDGLSRTVGHSYPEALLRYGIFADWFELRLGESLASEKRDLVRASGAEDLYLGCKLGLTAQDGIRPEMALVPQMTVPTGGSAFTNNEVLAGCNWLYGWDINERFSTAGSTQFNKAFDGTSGDTYTEWAQSWTFGYSIVGKLGGYSEWFALLPSGAETERTQHYFNSGFTYSLTNDIQWDIRAGRGLSEASADYFAGVGLVLRFR